MSVLDMLEDENTTGFGHTLRRTDDSIAKQALRVTPEGHAKEKDQRTPGNTSRERYADSGFEIQLEEDGGQCGWMERTDLLTM